MGKREYGHEPTGEGLLRVGKVKGTRAEEALKAPFVGGGGGVFGKGGGDLGGLAVLGEAQSVGEAGELFGFGAARVWEDGLDGLLSVVPLSGSGWGEKERPAGKGGDLIFEGLWCLKD